MEKFKVCRIGPWYRSHHKDADSNLKLLRRLLLKGFTLIVLPVASEIRGVHETFLLNFVELNAG